MFSRLKALGILLVTWLSKFHCRHTNHAVDQPVSIKQSRAIQRNSHETHANYPLPRTTHNIESNLSQSSLALLLITIPPRSFQILPPSSPHILSLSHRPNQHRNAHSRNSKNLYPPNKSLLNHALKELLHRIRIICSWERLIRNRTIEDLAKRFPTFFYVEEE